MLLPDTVVRAAARWLQILRQSSVAPGWSLIRADPSYTDITPTQYASALEWLSSTRLVVQATGKLELSELARQLPDEAGKELLFEHVIDSCKPAWLQDADALIRSANELPQDALDLAVSLGL